MMMHIYIFFVSLFIVSKSLGQDIINWQEASNWKIYKIRSREGFTVTVDSLLTYKHISLNDKKMKGFLKTSKPLPENENSVFSGVYVVSCEMIKGNPRKLLISTFGGFFYDEKTRRYFSIPERIRDSWYKYLSDQNKRVTYF